MADNSLVFLAAFANVYQQGEYLASLDDEAEALRGLVQPSSLEYEPIAGASLPKIADRLGEYRNQVTIFHYAGHAGPDRWKLEAGDGAAEAINANELASCFAGDPPPQLVFLNGCSTRDQAEAFLKAGVRTVVGTSYAIDDAQAKDFSVRFYRSLFEGLSVRAAFDFAAGLAKSRAGDDTRSVLKPMAKSASDSSEKADWPWRLYPEGNDLADHEWTIAHALENPLYLYPLPSKYRDTYPFQPYRHLKWYTRNEASIFFGRGDEIAELASQILSDARPRVVLFCGESGVGKSSLLEAGLAPRLETKCSIVTVRRDAKTGLVGAIEHALPPTDGLALSERWRKKEAALGKPFVVVLDQVEEAFTQPLPNEDGEVSGELSAFCDIVHSVFDEETACPAGRIVLSFRKEWLAEIEEALGRGHVATMRRVTIKRLGRRGVSEAIVGPAERTNGHYRLSVDPLLVEGLRNSLVSDPTTPVAPVLQILLHDLYLSALAKNSDSPHLSLSDYDTRTGGKQAVTGHVKAALLQMEKTQSHESVIESHSDAELQELSSGLTKAAKAGLVLDILMQHVTQDRTSQQVSLGELNSRYAHLQESVYSILKNCEQLHLLNFVIDKGDVAETQTRLLHDTLAGVIRELYDDSPLPGRTARRILDNAFAGVDESDLPEAMTLAQYLRLRRGLPATKALTNRERAWIKKSWRVGLSIAGVVLLAVGAISFGVRTILDDKYVESVPQLNSDELVEAYATVPARMKERLRSLLDTDVSPDGQQAVVVNNETSNFRVATLLLKFGEAHPARIVKALPSIESRALPLMADALAKSYRIDAEATMRELASLDNLTDFAPRVVALLMLLADRGVPVSWPTEWLESSADLDVRREVLLGLADETSSAALGGSVLTSSIADDANAANTAAATVATPRSVLASTESIPDVVIATMFASEAIAAAEASDDLTSTRNEWNSSRAVMSRLNELNNSRSAVAHSLAVVAIHQLDRRASDFLSGDRDTAKRLATSELKIEQHGAVSTLVVRLSGDTEASDGEERKPKRVDLDTIYVAPNANDIEAINTFRADASKVTHVGSPYWLAATEVPRPLYFEFLRSTGREQERTEVAEKLHRGSGATTADVALDFPASFVTLDEAIQFCNWLTDLKYGDESARCYRQVEAEDRGQTPVAVDSAIEEAPGVFAGLPPAPPFGLEDQPSGTIWKLDASKRGFRLPTEIEWEIAARAQAATPYSFGSDARYFNHFGWEMSLFEGRDAATVQPCGMTFPNAYGFLDMQGNLREWVTPTGTNEIDTSTNAITMDGAFDMPASECSFAKSMTRYSGKSRGATAWDRHRNVGFRIARTATHEEVAVRQLEHPDNTKAGEN